MGGRNWGTFKKTSFTSPCATTKLNRRRTPQEIGFTPELVTHSWGFEVFQKKLERWRWVGEED